MWLGMLLLGLGCFALVLGVIPLMVRESKGAP